MTSEEGGLVKITFEINITSLALGRHVRMFVVDDVPSKLKGFPLTKESNRSNRSNREFFTFSQRERFVPFFK